MKIGFYPGKNRMNNVVSFLKKHAEQQPDKVIFYFLEKNNKNSKNSIHISITYSEFYNMVRNFAKILSEAGIKMNDRLLVFVPISTELYIAIGALQYIGAIPVLLDSWLRQEQLPQIIKNSKPHGIIASVKWLQVCKEYLDNFGIKIQIPIESGMTIINNSVFSKPFSTKFKTIVPVSRNHTALITYTTGSTGVPKGVNRTHKFLAIQHYALKRLFPYKSDDVDLCLFPVFTLNNIASGITTVLPAIDINKPDLKDIKIILKQIYECKVNCMTLAPSVFRNLAIYCKSKKILLNNISRVLVGGAPIGEVDIRKFNDITPCSKNWILYGSTEVEPISYIEAKEMLSTKPSKAMNISRIGVNVGKIDKKLLYKFIDIEAGGFECSMDIRKIEVKSGEIGELVVSGEHVCEEYFNNKEAFKRIKIKDSSGNIWHRTGDLGYVDKFGYLWIVGRKHNVIKYRNEYFFSVRPEIILKNISNVVNAAYIDFEKNNKKLIAAVVTLKKSDKLSQLKCRKKIYEIFNKKKLPLDVVIFMKNIPMDVRHHSKVDYNVLRQKIYEIFK